MRHLPPLIATPDGYDTVRLWDCHPIPDVIPAWSAGGGRGHDGPAYRISPHCLGQREERYEVAGLLIEEARVHGNGYAVLVADPPPRMTYRRFDEPADHTTVFHRGDWVFMERMLYSWYHGAPIPVVEFTNTRRHEWPTHTDANIMEFRHAERRDRRRWLHRWDPARADSPQEPPPPQPPAPTPAPEAAKDSPKPQPLPKFVADLIIADAIAKSSVCPITMEPITAASAAATSCFHVFDANAIAIWLTNDDKCPTCKTRCSASA